MNELELSSAISTAPADEPQLDTHPCPQCGKHQMPIGECYRPCRCTELTWLDDEAKIPFKYKKARLNPETVRNQAQRAALAEARVFVEQFRITGAGLYLSGDTRTGKTYVACAIANALIQQLRTVQFWSIPDLVFDLGTASAEGNYGEFADHIVSRAKKVHLVILDDLGVERDTGFADETVSRIVRQRHNDDRPIIVTSQWPMKPRAASAATLKDRYDARLVERIREMTSEIYFGKGTAAA